MATTMTITAPLAACVCLGAAVTTSSAGGRGLLWDDSVDHPTAAHAARVLRRERFERRVPAHGTRYAAEIYSTSRHTRDRSSMLSDDGIFRAPAGGRVERAEQLKGGLMRYGLTIVYCFMLSLFFSHSLALRLSAFVSDLRCLLKLYLALGKAVNAYFILLYFCRYVAGL